MSRKLTYTKRLGKVVAQGAKGNTHYSYHIMTAASGKWAVVSDGAIRSVRAFLKKEDAVSFAQQYATSKGASELIIHEKDGSIGKRVSLS